MQTIQPITVGDRLTLLRILIHATPVVQVVLLGLILAVLTSVAVWAVLAAPGRRDESARAHGLAFLSAVFTCAPLFGLAAAAYGLMNMSIGLANLRPTPDFHVLAPGLAEASLSILLGALAAALASALRTHLRTAPEAPAAA